MPNRKSFLYLSSVLSAALGTATLAPPRTAQACGAISCEPPIRLFSVDVVPGDLIYFKVLTATPGPLVLEKSDGTPIAASIRMIGGDQIFAPESPVPAGTKVRLRYQDQCRFPVSTPDRTLDFTSAETSPVAFRPAVLELSERGILVGSTTDDVFARVRYLDPVESGDVRHLIDRTATVDGKAFPMEIDPSGLPSVIDVVSACGGDGDPWRADTCGIRHAAPAGAHSIVVTADIVGFDVTPAATSISVDTSCTVPIVPRAASQPTANTTISSSDSGGCALAGKADHPMTGLSIVGLIAGLLVGMARKRGLHR